MPDNWVQTDVLGRYGYAMVIDKNRAELAKRSIDAAFSGLVPPPDDRLLHPKCMDDGDIADFYGRPNIAVLPDAFLIRNYAAPSFFTAEAFRYYMPAFMRWSVEHPGSIEYVVESSLRAFDPGPAGDPLRDFQLSKFRLFDDAQRDAVVLFLQTFEQVPDLGRVAAAALAHYWRRPDGG